MAERFSSLRPDLARVVARTTDVLRRHRAERRRRPRQPVAQGLDTLRVLAPDRVAYLDLTGSGVETIAHLRENGRITLMACAFTGQPRISRIYGTGHVHPVGTPEFDELAPRVPRAARAGVRSSTSRSTGSRRRAATRCRSWISSTTATGSSTGRERKGDDGLAEYWETKNAASIDGLPGIDA